MESIWTGTATKKNFEQLRGDKKTDVLIIGGGITGILCAYMLKSSGVDCILAEADEICSGITKNTTAKITLQHGFIYDKIIKKYGTALAQQYYCSQRQAIEKYFELSKQIDCDFEFKDNYVYSIEDWEAVEDELEAILRIGGRAEYEEKLPLGFSVAGAVKTERQAEFNPLKFCYALASELNIYEKTRIIDIGRDGAVTNHGSIKAKKIIVATHFPAIDRYGAYFIKMYQHRSYVLALKNAPDLKGMYVDENKKGLSFRNYGKYLLLGGGSHRTGKKGGSYNELEKVALELYPDAVPVTRFATQDCMTLDGMPYIGRYSKNTPNLFVATGFNKWGMTSAMVAATLLCDLVQEKQNDYKELYNPSRSIIHPQLAINLSESLVGMLTPTVPRCPHLGCALKYNKAEHSWDCPCHGSRFSADGNLIDNPASKDKKL